MEKYANYGGGSNVEAFEIYSGRIVVKFQNTPRMYTYSYNSAGQANVETMKNLARQGSGLNSFIQISARNLYER